MSESAEKIADLIRQGKKIEAIKLLRETTGIDLKQAKEEIERMEAELSGSAPRVPGSSSDAEALSNAASKEVQDLARRGKKMEAIKLLREQTGMGMKDAKERVEAVTGETGSGCMTLLLLLAMVGIFTLQGLA